MAKPKTKLLGADGRSLGAAKETADNIAPIWPGANKPKVASIAKGPDVIRVMVPDIIDADAVPQPCGNTIIIQPVSVPVKSPSGLIYPSEVLRKAEYLRSVAKVIAIGPDCFKDETVFGPSPTPWCKVGDWICHDRYAGQPIPVNGQEFRQITDKSVNCVIPKPEAISFYIAGRI